MSNLRCYCHGVITSFVDDLPVCPDDKESVLWLDGKSTKRGDLVGTLRDRLISVYIDGAANIGTTFDGVLDRSKRPFLGNITNDQVSKAVLHIGMTGMEKSVIASYNHATTTLVAKLKRMKANGFTNPGTVFKDKGNCKEMRQVCLVSRTLKVNSKKFLHELIRLKRGWTVKPPSQKSGCLHASVHEIKKATEDKKREQIKKIIQNTTNGKEWTSQDAIRMLSKKQQIWLCGKLLQENLDKTKADGVCESNGVPFSVNHETLILEPSLEIDKVVVFRPMYIDGAEKKVLWPYEAIRRGMTYAARVMTYIRIYMKISGLQCGTQKICLTPLSNPNTLFYFPVMVGSQHCHSTDPETGEKLCSEKLAHPGVHFDETDDGGYYIINGKCVTVNHRKQTFLPIDTCTQNENGSFELRMSRRRLNGESGPMYREHWKKSLEKTEKQDFQENATHRPQHEDKLGIETSGVAGIRDVFDGVSVAHQKVQLLTEGQIRSTQSEDETRQFTPDRFSGTFLCQYAAIGNTQMNTQSDAVAQACQYIVNPKTPFLSTTGEPRGDLEVVLKPNKVVVETTFTKSLMGLFEAKQVSRELPNINPLRPDASFPLIQLSPSAFTPKRQRETKEVEQKRKNFERVCQDYTVVCVEYDIGSSSTLLTPLALLLVAMGAIYPPTLEEWVRVCTMGDVGKDLLLYKDDLEWSWKRMAEWLEGGQNLAMHGLGVFINLRIQVKGVANPVETGNLFLKEVVLRGYEGDPAAGVQKERTLLCRAVRRIFRCKAGLDSIDDGRHAPNWRIMTPSDHWQKMSHIALTSIREMLHILLDRYRSDESAKDLSVPPMAAATLSSIFTCLDSTNLRVPTTLLQASELCESNDMEIAVNGISNKKDSINGQGRGRVSKTTIKGIGHVLHTSVQANKKRYGMTLGDVATASSTIFGSLLMWNQAGENNIQLKEHLRCIHLCSSESKIENRVNGGDSMFTISPQTRQGGKMGTIYQVGCGVRLSDIVPYEVIYRLQHFLSTLLDPLVCLSGAKKTGQPTNQRVDRLDETLENWADLCLPVSKPGLEKGGFGGMCDDDVKTKAVVAMHSYISSMLPKTSFCGCRQVQTEASYKRMFGRWHSVPTQHPLESRQKQSFYSRMDSGDLAYMYLSTAPPKDVILKKDTFDRIRTILLEQLYKQPEKTTDTPKLTLDVDNWFVKNYLLTSNPLEEEELASENENSLPKDSLTPRQQRASFRKKDSGDGSSDSGADSEQDEMDFTSFDSEEEDQDPEKNESESNKKPKVSKKSNTTYRGRADDSWIHRSLADCAITEKDNRFFGQLDVSTERLNSVKNGIGYGLVDEEVDWTDMSSSRRSSVADIRKLFSHLPVELVSSANYTPRKRVIVMMDGFLTGYTSVDKVSGFIKTLRQYLYSPNTHASLGMVSVVYIRKKQEIAITTRSGRMVVPVVNLDEQTGRPVVGPKGAKWLSSFTRAGQPETPIFPENNQLHFKRERDLIDGLVAEGSIVYIGALEITNSQIASNVSMCKPGCNYLIPSPLVLSLAASLNQCGFGPFFRHVVMAKCASQGSMTRLGRLPLGVSITTPRVPLTVTLSTPALMPTYSTPVIAAVSGDVVNAEDVIRTNGAMAWTTKLIRHEDLKVKDLQMTLSRTMFMVQNARLSDEGMNSLSFLDGSLGAMNSLQKPGRLGSTQKTAREWTRSLDANPIKAEYLLNPEGNIGVPLEVVKRLSPAARRILKMCCSLNPVNNILPNGTKVCKGDVVARVNIYKENDYLTESAYSYLWADEEGHRDIQKKFCGDGEETDETGSREIFGKSVSPVNLFVPSVGKSSFNSLQDSILNSTATKRVLQEDSTSAERTGPNTPSVPSVPSVPGVPGVPGIAGPDASSATPNQCNEINFNSLANRQKQKELTKTNEDGVSETGQQNSSVGSLNINERVQMSSMISELLSQLKTTGTSDVYNRMYELHQETTLLEKAEEQLARVNLHNSKFGSEEIDLGIFWTIGFSVGYNGHWCTTIKPLITEESCKKNSWRVFLKTKELYFRRRAKFLEFVLLHRSRFIVAPKSGYLYHDLIVTASGDSSFGNLTIDMTIETHLPALDGSKYQVMDTGSKGVTRNDHYMSFPYSLLGDSRVETMLHFGSTLAKRQIANIGTSMIRNNQALQNPTTRLSTTRQRVGVYPVFTEELCKEDDDVYKSGIGPINLEVIGLQETTGGKSVFESGGLYSNTRKRSSYAHSSISICTKNEDVHLYADYSDQDVPDSPLYDPDSPLYDPGSPSYDPGSPSYDPGSPSY